MRALLERIRTLLRQKRIRNFFTRLVGAVAALTVFVTTYALVLPAITMEKQAACGIEEHQHSDSCYEDVLTCGLDETEGHRHEAACYTTARTLTCRLPEHTHAADCYDADGNLTCAREQHTHAESCYEETRTLTCGLAEEPAHHHTAACYARTLVCEKQVHTHSTECYKSAGDTADDTCGKNGSTEVVAHDAQDVYDEQDAQDAQGAQSAKYAQYAQEGADADAGSTAEKAANSTEGNTAAAGNSAAAGSTAAAGRMTAGNQAAENPAAAETSAAGNSAVAADENDGYTPALEELDFTHILTARTGIYYHGIGTRAGAAAEHADEKTIGNTGETNIGSTDEKNSGGADRQNTGSSDRQNTGSTDANETGSADWKKVEDDTVLSPADIVRVYLAYTIPAGSLNATNPVARYRLPAQIRLTDDRIDALNRTENGIAAQYIDRDSLTITDPENYHKYLGAEAVEGNRTPDKAPRDGDQEYISATVRAENIYDEKTGDYQGQDLIFTFVPYTIEKNRNTYEADGTPRTAGQKVTGFFAMDFSLAEGEIGFDSETISPISSSAASTDAPTSPAEGESSTDNTSAEQARSASDATVSTKTADITFVEAHTDTETGKEIREIKTRLVVRELVQNDRKTKDAVTPDADAQDAGSENTDAGDSDIQETGTEDSGAAKTDAVPAAQDSMPAQTFEDSVVVTTGTLSTDVGIPTTDEETQADSTKNEKTELKVCVESDEGTFPEGTTMVLSPIEGRELAEVTEAVEGTVETKTCGFQAVNISFRDAEGMEIEPAKPVRVTFTSSMIDQASDDDHAGAPVVIHVDDDGKAASVDSIHVNQEEYQEKSDREDSDQLFENASADRETDAYSQENAEKQIVFEADSFSTYVIVYTVDFYYGEYEYHLEGGNQIRLSALFQLLGIELAVQDVSDVMFTNSSLLRVERVEDDWTLTSLQPFDTVEKLDVEMADGGTLQIRVEDARITDNTPSKLKEGEYVLYMNSGGNNYSLKNDGSAVMYAANSTDDSLIWCLDKNADGTWTIFSKSDPTIFLNLVDSVTGEQENITIVANTIGNAGGFRFHNGNNYLVVDTDSGNPRTKFKIYNEGENGRIQLDQRVQKEIVQEGRVTIVSGTGGSVTNAGTYIKSQLTGKRFIAQADADFRFVKWITSDGKKYSENETLILPNTIAGSETYTAVFEPAVYTIQYTSADTSMGTVTNTSERVQAGNEAVGSTAEYNLDEYLFFGWKDENGKLACTSETFVPVGDQVRTTTYTAAFQKREQIYYYRISSNNEAYGNVTVEYTTPNVNGLLFTDKENPNPPLSGSVTAVPGANCLFDHWELNGNAIEDITGTDISENTDLTAYDGVDVGINDLVAIFKIDPVASSYYDEYTFMADPAGAGNTIQMLDSNGNNKGTAEETTTSKTNTAANGKEGSAINGNSQWYAKPVPGTGYRFVNWTNNGKIYSFRRQPSTNGDPNTIQPQGKNKDNPSEANYHEISTFVANFAPVNDYLVTFLATEGGHIVVTANNRGTNTAYLSECNGEVAYAAAEPGYHQVGWRDENGNFVTGTHAGDSRLYSDALKPNSDQIWTAVFEPVTEVDIYYRTNGTFGTVSRESEHVIIAEGAQGATAAPRDGYKFISWADQDGKTVWPLVEFTPYGDMLYEGATYTAVFESDAYTRYLQTSVVKEYDDGHQTDENPGEAGYISSPDYESSVNGHVVVMYIQDNGQVPAELTAVATEDWVFDHWEVDDGHTVMDPDDSSKVLKGPIPAGFDFTQYLDEEAMVVQGMHYLKAIYKENHNAVTHVIKYKANQGGTVEGKADPEQKGYNGEDDLYYDTWIGGKSEGVVKGAVAKPNTGWSFTGWIVERQMDTDNDGIPDKTTYMAPSYEAEWVPSGEWLKDATYIATFRPKETSGTNGLVGYNMNVVDVPVYWPGQSDMVIASGNVSDVSSNKSLMYYTTNNGYYYSNGTLFYPQLDKFPVAEGYEFVGWYNKNRPAYGYQEATAGNIISKADISGSNWYDDEGGVYSNMAHDYKSLYFPYQSDNGSRYTFEAIWVGIKAKSVRVPYDSDYHELPAEAYFEVGSMTGTDRFKQQLKRLKDAGKYSMGKVQYQLYNADGTLADEKTDTFKRLDPGMYYVRASAVCTFNGSEFTVFKDISLEIYPAQLTIKKFWLNDAGTNLRPDELDVSKIRYNQKTQGVIDVSSSSARSNAQKQAESKDLLTSDLFGDRTGIERGGASKEEPAWIKGGNAWTKTYQDIKVRPNGYGEMDQTSGYYLHFAEETVPYGYEKVSETWERSADALSTTITFSNTPIKTTFNFSKEWQNADQSTTWPQREGADLPITVTLKRRLKVQTLNTSTGTYEDALGRDTIEDNTFSESYTISPSDHPGRIQYEDGVFTITGLIKNGRIGSDLGEWEYYMTEAAVDGYESKYYLASPKSGEQDKEVLLNGGVIKNTETSSYELPETGGPGLFPSYAFGILLVSMALIYLIIHSTRRKKQL